MKILKYLLVLCTAGLISSCHKQVTVDDYSVIPLPAEVTLTSGTPFSLNSDVVVVYPVSDRVMQRNAEFLSEYIEQSTGYRLVVESQKAGEQSKRAIVLRLTNEISQEEGYRLTVAENQILIEGKTSKGVFYGIQTLRKSIPAIASGSEILLPAGVVNDAPRFSYRGMHLDVVRHFFPVDFVKRYIDLLALHNMNTLHWHLTDDQGWRIDIKKYPNLAEIASVRHCTVKGYLGSGEYDHTTYGGYYTQEQLKEIVAYANERFVQVIPEVDLPGHMLAVLAAYPEFGCTGGPYEVSPDWGVFEDVLCVGNEKAMQFLEDVMLEVMDIFPSKYIHIGGDEAPRTRWQSCKKCQARIQQEGLKGDNNHTAEDMLQSYCMKCIEKFLNAHGRQIIGWDEILEGEVSPNATVMSWRGSAGGIKAAQMGHDVIMTPNTHCYFDFYQTDDTKNEPLAIGGFLPLEKVYSLEPTEGLTPEQASHVLGAQANVWTEYISTTKHLEYMILPRMAALSEVQWIRPAQKDYKHFTNRISNLLDLYHRDGFNYAPHIYNIKADCEVDTLQRALKVQIHSIDHAPIYYTLDGSQPTEKSFRCDRVICIAQSVDLKAVAIREAGMSNVIEKCIYFNKATLASVQFVQSQPVPNYTFKGAVTLVDGLRGNENFSTGAWLGFLQDEVTLLLDLHEKKTFSKLGVNAMTYMDAWIMAPIQLQVFVSDDNQNFKNVAKVDFPAETDVKKREIKCFEATFSSVESRYVKVVVKGSADLPKNHVSVGAHPFLFMDEISLD